MTDRQPTGQLREISPDKIVRNPDNPRLFFRPEEMDTLMGSIRRFGIQVPLSVYQEGEEFVLIDGERRWRCALKLNLKKVPALIQPKPSPLNNLLLMFNVHALREQWDYLTIANKLPVVIDLFVQENGAEPNETELSEVTGLTRGQIRRCRFLFDLPKKYVGVLEEELALPKSRQKLSEDFFIEMERALKTVQNRVPSAITTLDAARDTLIDKFRDEIIGNITDFRKLSKIATSVANLGVAETKARKAIRDIFDPTKQISIADVYARQFEAGYDEKRISSSIESIYGFLDELLEADDVGSLDNHIVIQLERLREIIDRILGGDDAV